MKISKKLLAAFSVAAMLVTALSVTGCKKEEDDENAINGNAISIVNDTAVLYRSFESLRTNHVSSTAEITINNPKELVEKYKYSATNTNGHKANSVIGYVFGLEEVKKDALPSGYPEKAFQLQKDGSYKEQKITYYNFCIAGVRWNAIESKLQWYVSKCENIPNTIFGYNTDSDFSAKIFTDANGTKSATSYGTETPIVPTTGTFETLNHSLLDNGTLKVRIQVKVNADGAYTVTLQNQQGVKIEGSTVANVPVTGLTTKTQKEIGRYVTVYAGETANAVMTFSDTTGNPIPVSEDDWVDLSK